MLHRDEPSSRQAEGFSGCSADPQLAVEAKFISGGALDQLEDPSPVL
jgi:hypothetical protein